MTMAGPWAMETATTALPSSIPTPRMMRAMASTRSATIAHHPTRSSTGPPYLLTGHDRFCIENDPRLVMYDVDGEIRWYYEGIPPIDLAFDTGYVGAGLFSWGGGYYDNDAPELIQVDHELAYRTTFPGSESTLYHHDGKLLSSGEMLVMSVETNSLGGYVWDGFGLRMVDPETGAVTWDDNSQTTADAGDLAPGWGDPWHANWADLYEDPAGDDLVLVSLCGSWDVMAIERDTQATAWKLSDMTILSTGGVPLPTAGTECQHGLEYTGDRLLVYDNG